MRGCSRDTHRLGVEGGRGRNDDTTAAVRRTFFLGGRDFWVWRGRLQGELVMVLPVCRIPVSICCDKRREISLTVPAESGRGGERSRSCVYAHS